MSEAQIRLAIFLSVLILMASLEFIIPPRKEDKTRGIRWLSNIGISVLNIAFLRLLLPFTAISTALYAEKNGLGLFNVIEINATLKIILTIVLFDLFIYAQHVVFHKSSFFWRFHKMHHADKEFDVTTGIRFHPIESLLSMVIKGALVLMLGAPVFAVLIFEIILNACSMFSHSNVKLPFDNLLRKLIVTPDMHRIHHSVHRAEHDTNYGFCLSVWDKIFKTYTQTPKDSHEQMHIGLTEFRGQQEARLDKMLTQPFREK